MADFPFCVIGDVEALTAQHRSGQAYSASTKPTAVQVADFMDRIAADLRAHCVSYGYDLDNLATSSNVAGAVTAGSAVEVAVTTGDGSNFSVGDEVFINGIKTGVRKYEFDYLTGVSTDTLTIATVDNNYDASTITLYVMNDALRTLRDLNALGAAAKALEAAYGSISPNATDREDELWARYYGSEENKYGLWAIEHVDSFLRGAARTDDAAERSTITSYGSENSTDTDVAPVFEKDMDF